MLPSVPLLSFFTLQPNKGRVTYHGSQFRTLSAIPAGIYRIGTRTGTEMPLKHLVSGAGPYRSVSARKTIPDWYKKVRKKEIGGISQVTTQDLLHFFLFYLSLSLSVSF